jgi:hypothetical protein
MAQLNLKAYAKALVQMDEGAHPVSRLGGMAFAGEIFGEKHVTRSKDLDRAVANTNLNGAGQCDAPLPAWSGVPS